MWEGKKEPKYYKVRVSVLLLVIVTIIIAFFGLLTTKESQNQERIIKHNDTYTEENQNRNWVDVTFNDLQSNLNKVEKCYLSGSNSKGLMSYYRKFDTLGLISLNDWYVIPFQLKNYDQQGNERANDNVNRMGYGNTGQLTYSSQGTPSRGMADIEITLPENYEVDVDFLQDHLCQDCLNRVATSLEYSKGEDEDKGAIPLCIVDFETLEVYPVQESSLAYFVRDYWVELEFQENEVEVEAYYLPEK